ncbi:hypothetical protein ACROYT_G014496 [Oculina patagonica]
MKRLQNKGENSLVYTFCACVGKDRPGKEVTLMLLERMPFGLLEYSNEFFTCTNIHQVSRPLNLVVSYSPISTGATPVPAITVQKTPKKELEAGEKEESSAK